MKNYEPNLSRGLDYYKLTMGDVALEKHPDAEVTFTLKNRNTMQPLSEYVSPSALQYRLDAIRDRGFSSEEVAYYAGLKAQNNEARFTPEYLEHIANLQLPKVTVELSSDSEELALETTGSWPDVSLWETVAMSEINEEYYSNLMQSHGLDISDLYAEGDRRLDTKIEKLLSHPNITFADFGTRRRFSADWHEHVIERLAAELPENFIGTSNPWFAYKYNLTPIGTFAHELPMVYAGLEDAKGNNPLDGHAPMFKDWEEHYQGDLSIALTDTFGSEFFFTEFTPEQARKWKGLRHDSGDPFEFGEHAIDYYKQSNVDPATKTIVFSDGLDIDKIIALAEHFSGRINTTFGWGTSLMNDLGLPANNFVMKATKVNNVDTVKLSDDTGKHTGPDDKVHEYQSRVALAIAKVCQKQLLIAR